MGRSSNVSKNKVPAVENLLCNVSNLPLASAANGALLYVEVPMIYDSKRTFQVWDYRVSHQQLLLRSPRNTEFDSNIDIIFFGVEYINVPILVKCLCINPQNDHRNLHAVSISNNGSTFEIISANSSYHVIASSLNIFENRLDIFDSTLIDVNKPRQKAELGVLLASFP